MKPLRPLLALAALLLFAPLAQATMVGPSFSSLIPARNPAVTGLAKPGLKVQFGPFQGQLLGPPRMITGFRAVAAQRWEHFFAEGQAEALDVENYSSTQFFGAGGFVFEDWALGMQIGAGEHYGTNHNFQGVGVAGRLWDTIEYAMTSQQRSAPGQIQTQAGFGLGLRLGEAARVEAFAYPQQYDQNTPGFELTGEALAWGLIFGANYRDAQNFLGTPAETLTLYAGWEPETRGMAFLFSTEARPQDATFLNRQIITMGWRF